MNPGNHEMGSWHPFARSTEADLQILAAGEETGWWDESGRPAPWTPDFLEPAAGWTTALADGPTSDQDQRADGPGSPPF